MAADIPYVRSMRIRLIVKMMSITIMLVTTIIGARSCSGSGGNSPLTPANLEQSGLGGLCAQQQAVAAATGDDSAQTLSIPRSADNLSNMPGLAALAPGPSISCSTTTSGPGG